MRARGTVPVLPRPTSGFDCGLLLASDRLIVLALLRQRNRSGQQSQLEQRVEHDMHYINNWSVLFDLYIIGRTVPALLRGR